MSNGWILIHRQLLKKGYYTDSEYVHLWVHLLLKCNHKEKEFLFNGKLQTIKRGQFITGRNKLSKETGINPHKIQRILNVFETEQQIAQQMTNKFRLITVLNYNEYQVDAQLGAPPAHSKRTASAHKQRTRKNKKEYKGNQEKFLTHGFMNRMPTNILCANHQQNKVRPHTKCSL